MAKEQASPFAELRPYALLILAAAASWHVYIHQDDQRFTFRIQNARWIVQDTRTGDIYVRDARGLSWDVQELNGRKWSRWTWREFPYTEKHDDPGQ